MKLLVIFTLNLFLFSLVSFAQETCKSESVSSACFREMTAHGDTYERANQLCNNVSNDCYVDFRKSGVSKKLSRNKCLDVANNCFIEVSRYHSNCLSSRVCNGVNNNCYVKNRRAGRMISRSIKLCELKVVHCRVCEIISI
jgi:hypothetical protein